MRNIIVILLMFIILSCTSDQEKILKQADSIMESRPDSAMTLLDGIDRSKLNKSELPYYALLYTQAQVKTDIPLDSDSLISIAYLEYGQDSNGDRGIRSNYYTGEVFFNQKKYTRAMRHFLTVYEESQNIGNDYWHAKAAARISDLFFLTYKYYEAEKYIREAADLLKSVGRETFHLYALAALANVYLNNGNDERAYHLLDSLKNIVINMNPVDSSLLHYMNIHMMSAMLNTGRVGEVDPADMELSDKDLTDGELVDDAVFQSHLLDTIGKANKATENLRYVQRLAHTDEDKVHVLYAQYENAKSIGDQSLALSLVDSMLFYQNKVAEDIISESVIGAERDFHVDMESLHRHRSYFFKTMLIAACMVFMLFMAFIIVFTIYRKKAHDTELNEKLESINSLRTYSKSILHDKYVLENSVNDKEILIHNLTERINEGIDRVRTLDKQISEKEIATARLQALLEDKDLELGHIQDAMTQKEREYRRIYTELYERNAEKVKLQLLLNENYKKEVIQAHIVEKLFKEKWTTLDMLCNQYFSLNNSELSEKSILSNIEKEVKRITSKKGIAEIVEAVDIHMNGIVTAMRNQCPFLKEDDIHYIALTYAGFSARSVCLFTGIKYKHYYVKKSRLIERLRKSDATDKELFISKMK